MKRLVVCCDGTWSTPDQEKDDRPSPTNVVRLHNAVADEDSRGVRQEKYYHAGVGTEGSLLARSAGGMWGEGLDKNIESAYAWLATNYKPGDAIYLFGFSRGAYTVRALAGALGAVGVPQLQGLAPSECWTRIATAFRSGYRDRPRRPRAEWGPEWAWRAKVSVQFIGVWDTVGALGIPDDMAFLNLLDQSAKWRFLDTRLGAHVKKARHALAVDEMRASFTPTLWTDETGAPVYREGERIRQCWFPGVHSDVGGGYPDTGLADIALDWMIAEASQAEAAGVGLAFTESMLAQVRPDPRGVLHDSVRGVFKALRTRPRNYPDFGANGHLHPSVLERHRNPPITQAPYHPSRRLSPGQELSVPVYARERWNSTGLYLEAGASYEFSASGEWMDSSIKCGPEGTNDGHFQFAEIAQIGGTVLGKLEGVFGSLTGNADADFVGSRRVEAADWFSLVGVVANADANPRTDGSPAPHQELLIGEGPYQLPSLAKGGYLFAFANDSWHFYENNRGSVLLRVKRTA